MESSIAEFVERHLACELLPTESWQDQAITLVKCFGHLERGWECACLANQQKKFRVCGTSESGRGLHVPGTGLLRVEVGGTGWVCCF